MRGQFVLSDKELEIELTRMTDAFTDELFAMPRTVVIKFPISRLIVDVERFENDADEPMSKVGMGKIPMKTSHGERLRRELGTDEVNNLITKEASGSGLDFRYLPGIHYFKNRSLSK